MSAWDASSAAAPLICAAAEPTSPEASVTAPMFFDTSLVPCAACCTLRLISLVAAPCSSTAEAMVAVTAFTFSIDWPIAWIAVTAPWVAAWIASTCCAISSVARASASPGS